MWISKVDAADATGKLASLYETVRDPTSGQLDHIMQVHSLHPEGLEAHYQLLQWKDLRKRATSRGDLDPSTAASCRPDP